MNKKVAIGLLIGVMAVCVAAFIIATVLEGFSEKMLIRMLIPFCLGVSSLAKVLSGNAKKRAPRRTSEFYEREYGYLIKGAFAGEERKTLLHRLTFAIHLYNQDKPLKAIKMLEGLIPKCQTTDDLCAVHTFMALCYEDAGYTEQAIDHYYLALKQDQTRATLWSNLGLLMSQKGKFGQAISLYLNAIDHDPQYAQAHSNLANAFYRTGYYKDAVFYAEKALELKNDLYQAASCLALCHLILGNEEQSAHYATLYTTLRGTPGGLPEALEAVRAGQVSAERLVPLDEKTEKAVHALYRESARPFVRMGIGNKDEGKSRVGGALDKNDVPLDQRGIPMKLLCALFLSEIHSVSLLPSKGVLRFYIEDTPSLGFDPQNPNAQKGFKVLFDENEDAFPSSICQKTVSKEEFFPVKGCYPITFYPDMNGISFADHRFKTLFDEQAKKEGAPLFGELSDEERGELRRTLSGEGHRVCGYPHFTKEDPRALDPSLQRYDTLLLQIDWHDGLVEFPGQGVCNFFIPLENLKNKDFSDILYIVS